MKNWIVYLLPAFALVWSLTRIDETSKKSQATAAENKMPTAASALAAPLLHHIFTSTCIKNAGSFYRESLAFSAEGTTTFTQNFFVDDACKEPEPRETVQKGSYALAQEEEGKLLLTVRHLDPKRPYFEALIKVEKNQLLMESQLYTAL